ncbi:MAG: Thioredoxin reductase [candidate division TA06 bacterium 34_109]|uniref:Thioredoxin reductase n=1 Tax=candidate division TA06 bacterium 34_109 TaxID=1635277 RepID=A0A101I0S7_UNCT6|nr:MAG: Thioredoxin reductase [candidate division TA06 bacterium 34_109]
MISQKINQKDHIYENIIVGGGPAGLTAGIYLSRSRFDVLLFEQGITGGQANLTEIIENYPGFPDGILGPELMQRFERQAKRFGLEIKNNTVLSISRLNQVEGKLFEIKTDDDCYYSKSVIIATGGKPNKLGVPGEEKMTGRGVSYCGTCDGAFFREKDIVVVGGGDTALEEALFLTKFASKVTIVHRRDKLRAVKILQERAFNNPRIDFLWNSVVLGIEGDKQVEAIQLKNLKTGMISTFPCQGVFIFTGYSPVYPSLGSLKEQLVNENGYIVTDENMRTKIEGIFACGDVCAKVLRQVVTACGEGAKAAFSVEEFLR